MSVRELDSVRSGMGAAAGTCEHSNEQLQASEEGPCTMQFMDCLTGWFVTQVGG